jgi:hypothetical protein
MVQHLGSLTVGAWVDAVKLGGRHCSVGEEVRLIWAEIMHMS